MKEVTLTNLEHELTLIGSKFLALVVLWNIHCSHCKYFLDMLRNIEPNYPKFKIYTVQVDDVPLFAPPAIPSVSVFFNRARFFEAVGVTDQKTFEEGLKYWEFEWENNIKKGR
jgi:hypothetical protein